MDRYIGRLLDGRYEILEIIGAGGMAVVYKARCHRLNRLVAVKILKDENLADEDFRRRFHAESQAIARLGHPNIVAVYDVSYTDEEDYIVMELIDGITLKQFMESRGRLHWKAALHFAIQIAKALEHAHSKGLVHRDIKPHNVMVLKNGSVKVADFGIARMAEESNTMTKEALGSVHYISPEQASGGRVDNRSDLYSLGVVMYEMITGRPPFEGDTPLSVVWKHLYELAPRPASLVPDIPCGLEQIILKAMAHDLQDRYSSATAMLRDLETFRKNPAVPLASLPDPATHEHKPLPKGKPVSHPAEPEAEATKVLRPVRREKTWNEQHADQEPKEDALEDTDGAKSKIATAAIIICSVVAMIAIIIFMVLMTENNLLSTALPQESGNTIACQQNEDSRNPFDLGIVAQGQAVETTGNPAVNEEPDLPQQENTTPSTQPMMETMQIVMEHLVGMSREEAQQILIKQGLTNVRWAEQESYLPAGTVIGQSVAPNTLLTQDSPIMLTCAAGAVTVPVTLDMPVRTESYLLSVLLDGRPVVTDKQVAAYQATVKLELTGKDKQTCEIYIDGRLYQTFEMDFNAYAGK